MQDEVTKILLIEDDPAEAGLIKGMLAQQRGQEFSVEHVEYLADALSLLENLIFDCILVDLGLPDSQGLETAFAVRNHAKSTPVAIITILDDEEMALKALAMDIQDYLIKDEISGPMLTRSIRYAIQRKHIAAKLQESEERFASFMLNMPVAAWMKDMEGRYVYANAEAERIFSTPLAKLLGKTDWNIFPAETARRFGDNDRRALLEGGRLQTTEVLEQADHIEHRSIVNKFVVSAPDGKPAYIAGFALDITERIRAEEALRESEEKFSRIFDTVPVGVTITALEDSRFVEINREGERLSGFRSSEVIGRTVQELDIWTSPAERARMIEETLKEGVVRDREMTFHTKDGKILQGLFSAVVVDIGGKRHLLSMVSDITDRKRAEDALRIANAQLQIITESMAVGVVRCSRDLRYLWASAEYAQWLRLKPEEIKGRGIAEIIGKEGYQTITPYIERVLTGERVAFEERVNYRGVGELWITAIYTATFDAEGVVDGWVEVVIDVTERRKTEEEIKRLNAELQEKTFDLEAANKDLEAFNYTAAHDLRQPLNAIGAYSQALLEICGDALGEQGRSFVQESYNACLRMNRLIEALLKFSSLAHAEPLREVVDLSSMARKVAEELKVTAPERRVAFRISDGIDAVGDPKLLRLVLENLMGNAWKYTSAQEEAAVDFGAAEIAGTRAYFVRDNGAGFDKGEAEKLFTPFQRLSGANQFKGFGIGLATVERIIARHGGKVWAEGESGKGATFYFTLPASGTTSLGGADQRDTLR